MITKEILSSANHRPWSLPEKPWSVYQEWNKAIFLHWKVDIKKLRPLVPKELEIDLFDGEAWVSLVAFDMHNIHPKRLPVFPSISNFYEINIRTYIKYKGKSGVFFLSIEGGKLLSCKIAKAVSGLPYRKSKMHRTENSFSSSNNEFKDEFNAQFEIGKDIESKTDLDLWLTERYSLAQDFKNGINQFEIHHIEWPLKQIELKDLCVSYSRFEDLFSGEPDLCAYSPGVQVLSWNEEFYS